MWPLISLMVVLSDQISKILVSAYFPQYITSNQGISFGLLPSPLWLIINLLVIAVFIFMVKKRYSTGFIVGGGISNVLDRIFRGKVIDFIDFDLLWGTETLSGGGLPVFNLADACIVFGVILFILDF